ncbi:MAG: radical SAM protein [Candidatus Omnitrophica bacterium]|nr:radical SAM protein [Candidatus Omnitrophota bacterium]
MKIILINTPIRNPLRAEIPLKIDREIGALPALGLLSLASFLKERLPEQEVNIIDARIDNMDLEDIRKTVDSIRPDLVGITTMTFSLLDVLDTARVIKGIDSNIKICLGGPHVSIYPKETLSFKEVDFVIQGEGEEAFLHLVNNLNEKTPLFNIRGLGLKDEHGNLHLNGGKQIIEDLDILPDMDIKLINYKKCYSPLGVGKFMMTLQSSRGCPFQCIYCDQQSGKILRKRSIKKIIAEIKEFHTLGIKDIFFVDDLFTLDRKRVFEFCNGILEEKIDVFFKISARVDTIDREMLAMLKKAGCYRIHYGVESGSQRILNRLKKGITIEQIENTFQLTKDAGIDTFAYFMLGCPGETRQEIMATINFALNLNPSYAHFSIATPYPDTELYRMALEEGLFKEDYWRKFAQCPDKEFKTRFWTKELKMEELISLQNYVNRRFYFRVPFLIKELRNIPSWSSGFKKMKMAYKIFTS